MTHKDEILAYLRRYSSQSQPKSVTAIAETLSLDEETVGYVIHDLLAMNILGKEGTHSVEGYAYYILQN